MVLLTVRVGDVPFVPDEERVELAELGKGFWKAAVRYGFMDRPDVPRALAACRAPGLEVDLMLTSFFLARETLIPSPRRKMSRVAERLFILLAAAALPRHRLLPRPAEPGGRARHAGRGVRRDAVPPAYFLSLS